ncbi:MAG: sulfatase [Candidatus Sulfotelmatobacter sp.]
MQVLKTPLLFILLATGWSSTPVRPQAGSSRLIRFDDQLQSASVQASPKGSSVTAAEPIVWQNFFSEADLTWTLARGRIGYRNGDMMVKGEGSTPVILSPKEPAIDWSLYDAVEIRMAAQGGNEVKIKIGDFESKQKLGPPGQYQLYHFEVHVDAPKGARPLGIMPTDSVSDAAAIHSIKLVPRRANFTQPAGRESIGKQDEYRNAVYVHSPSTLAYNVSVPKNAHVHFGMGITAKTSPIKFRVSVEGSPAELFSKTVTTLDDWSDGDVDLSRFAGRNIRLLFRTDSDKEGAVALWANPLLTVDAPKPRPNVLIYLIDTLRADHSSLYGYKRNTTPFLKQLGSSGLVFEDCQTQATWTKPSTASLMTSLYSFTHGIINDADTIPSASTTIADQLRAGGYVTASIVTNPFAGRTTGLQRGFDYMDEYPVVLRNRTDAIDRGTDSAALNKVVFPWLERHRNEPFFLYAHATDPHAPYRPPQGFEEKFANPAETADFNRDYMKLRTEREYGGGTVVNRAGCVKAGIDPDRFIHRAIDRYDGEILHNDHSLELLVNKLKQLGILDNTLIIVVSDHGEEFWDHGWTAHGHSLYQELTHGVFVMWNPKLLPTPRRIAEPVQLIDVMPTVLDLVGLKIPVMVEGQSLAPLLRGKAFQRKNPVMSSRFAHPDALPDGPVRENRTDTFAFVDAKWKLIYRDKAAKIGMNKVELYDRIADRAEQKNIAAAHPREVERMMNEVGKWIDAQNKIRVVLGHGGKSTLDQQTIDQLRSLGYLGGAPQ